MTAIGFGTNNVDDVAFLIDGQGAPVRGVDVLMAKSQASSLTPTTWHPPGTVLVKKTSTGKYYLATDTSDGDRNTAPSITSDGHTDANGVISLVGNHGTISVTTSTGTGTEANHVTDLNGDTEFATHYLASSADGELTIAALGTGPGEYFYMAAGTIPTAGFAEGPANGVKGLAADYRVTSDFAALADTAGTAQDFSVANLMSGHFRSSVLSSLTDEAQAVLESRGSIFG